MVSVVRTKMAAVETRAFQVEIDNKLQNSGESFDVCKNEQLLKDLCEDYAKYVNVDISKQTKTLDDTIEEMLLRLDEFVALIDVVRSDNNQCLNRTMPAIYKKCECLGPIKKKIDNLEAFVKVVQENVNIMEEKVTLAEQELRRESSLEKVFKPFLKKKPTSLLRSPRRPNYEEPEIFNTSDYFTQELEMHIAQLGEDVSQTDPEMS